MPATLDDVTNATTALLAAVNVQKATLDTAVSNAAGSAAAALAIYGNTTDMAAAVASADSSASLALTRSNIAGVSASAASASAAQALSAAGTAGQYSTALAAIASQTVIVPAATVTGFNGVVVASCIYNARNDSDGGAKRRACQDKTWNYEPTTATGKNLGKLASLAAAWAVSGASVGDHYYDQTTKLFYSIGGTSGAPTRAEIVSGPRRDMPEVVGVTIEAGRAVLWDFTDATQPMWRVFKSTAYNAAGCGIIGYTPNLSSCSMVEGILAVGNNFASSGYYGSLIVIDFYADSAKSYSGAGTSVGFTGNWTLGIGNRHTLGGYNGAALPAPVGIVVNSVVACIAPNAPVNPASGMLTPTIVIGTSVGVGVFKDDGTASNKLFTWSLNNDSIAVVNGILYGGNSANISGYYVQSLREITGATFTGTPMGSSVLLGQAGWLVPNRDSLIYSKSTAKTGIYLHKENLSSPNGGMLANITTSIPGCWQVGDSHGAWLADTIVETVNGSNIITGDSANFNGGTVGSWVGANGAVLSVASQQLVVTGGGTTNFPEAVLVLTGLVIGKSYQVGFQIVSTGTNGILISGETLSPQTGAGYYYPGAPGQYYTTFTATANVRILALVTATASTSVGIFDNISIIECSSDRSVKTSPLPIYGSLNKAPVASGSQLVAWSGFAAGTNYLEQAYSANLDFGTGDFCFPIWINPTTAAQNSTLFTRSPAVLAGNGFALNLVGGVLQLGRSIAGAAFANTSFGYTPPVGIWTLVNLVRVAGVIALRVSGVQQDTTIADTNSYTNASAVFTVGVDYTHANPFGGSLALLRASATPASTGQGVYRYETERKLFLPGTQCCIAGNSSVVITPPDFDESTGITSIPTSWGVTEFVGLQAINSYATTVGVPACIATRSGYKLLSGATGTSLYKPSRLLAEELTRTYEQRKSFGAALKKRSFIATAGQTDFDMGIGEEPAIVYQQGIQKDEAAGAGLYTVLNSGFRKTVRLGTAATLNDRVTIFYTLNM
jgi:hypothetical protein